MSKSIELKLRRTHRKWLQIGGSFIRDDYRSYRVERYLRRTAARDDGLLMVRDIPEDFDVLKLSLYDNEGIN